MTNLINAAPGGERGGSSGRPPGGGGEPPGVPNRPLFGRGFYTAGFAVAAGVALAITYMLALAMQELKMLPLPVGVSLPELGVTILLFLFGAGVVLGFSISVIYNFLVIRRHVIFGLEVQAES